MRFDAYSATVRPQGEYSSWHTFAEAISHDLGGFVSKGSPKPRFGETLHIDVGSHLAAWVAWNATDKSVYIEGKGETSPYLVESIRHRWPDHSAPRLDVCEDFDEEGAFNALLDIARKHKGPRVKSGYVALPDDDSEGKTWAAGVRGSPAYLRIYEKGKQPQNQCLARPNWARIELEARPHYARDKKAASTWQPADVWGLSAWSHRVGEAVAQVPIKRHEPAIRRYSQDKTIVYIAQTFRRRLEALYNDGVDIGRSFKEVWDLDDIFNRHH